MPTEFNDKQLKILQAAELLFAEKSFDGTSIRDIAGYFSLARRIVCALYPGYAID